MFCDCGIPKPWILSLKTDYNGVFTLDDTETDNETYEISRPMASAIFFWCSVNTFIQFYVSHFNRSRYLSQYQSWSRSVWKYHKIYFHTHIQAILVENCKRILWNSLSLHSIQKLKIECNRLFFCSLKSLIVSHLTVINRCVSRCDIACPDCVT